MINCSALRAIALLSSLLLGAAASLIAQDTTFTRHIHSKTLNVTLDKKSGSIRSISGFKANLADYGVSAIAFTESNVENFGKMFVDDYTEVFGFTSLQMKKQGIFMFSDDWDLTFVQSLNDVPVDGSEIHFRIDPKGYFTGITTKIYPDVHCNTDPVLSSDTCLSIIRSVLRMDDARMLHSPQLVIIPKPRGDSFDYHLCWKMDISTSDPKGLDWEFAIDAADGEILRQIGVVAN